MTRSARLPKASDFLVTAIRQRILSERLPVGTRIASETELMAEHGLGRVTVREGLRILEQDGLIYIKRGAAGGIFVREVGIGRLSESLALLLSIRDTTLEEFAEFRLNFEPPVARLAAQNATEEQREQLLESARRGGHGRHVADFHELVGQASGNGVHAIVLAAFGTTLESQVRYDRVTRDTSDRNVSEHREIALAIASGDAEAAEKAMRLHLEAYRDFVSNANLLSAPIIPRATDHDTHPM